MGREAGSRSAERARSARRASTPTVHGAQMLLHLHVVRAQSPPHVLVLCNSGGAAPSSSRSPNLPARHRHGQAAARQACATLHRPQPVRPGPSTARWGVQSKAKGQARRRTTRTTSTALLLNMIFISSVTSHRSPIVPASDLPLCSHGTLDSSSAAQAQPVLPAGSGMPVALA
jgi:hypothetical protein